MRTAMLLAVLMACSALQAGLEPRDEALLQGYLSGDLILPGALPVSYIHKFEVGDLQESEVLDRGVYRTIRLHVVAKIGEEFLCELHNGRGLVFAGLMNNNGEFSKAWAGRAGAKPTEIKFRTHQHMQQIMHDALRVPWPTELYNVPAMNFHEGAKFQLGDVELSTQGGEYLCSGVRYELRQSHGAENWFGPHWQWIAEGVVLYRVVRREKLAKPEPYLDWSDVDKNLPVPVGAPAWKPPLEGWKVEKRDDGSLLVISYESAGEFLYLDDQLQSVSGFERIGPFGRRKVDAYSPGPFVLPAGMTLQLQPPNTKDWAQLDFLFAQASRLPVSMLVLGGLPAGDRGLRALKDYAGLLSLDVYPQGAELTEAGFAFIAGLPRLRELSFTFIEADRGLNLMGPLKKLNSVRRLALHSPELTEIPAAVRGWTSLESIEITGKDAKGIEALAGLKSVTLLHAEVSRTAAEQVAALPRLESLEIHSTEFPASLVRKMSGLEKLALTTDSAEDASFIVESAAKLKSLHTLELTVEKLAGEDLLALARCGVETLKIFGGLDRAEDVAVLAKLTSVTDLTLVKVAGANAIGLQSLAAPRTLKQLTLVEPVLQRSRTASVELAALAKFDFLEELHVRDCAMARLGPLGLKKFGKLKALTLGRLNVQQETLDELASCPKLESLSLEGSLLPQGVETSLAKLKSLKTLSLRGCLSVTPDAFDVLTKALPQCKVSR